MSTEWKSQQGEGKFALQFETDDVQKYKLVEKAAQMAIDGKTEADFVEVCRCCKCSHCKVYISNGGVYSYQCVRTIEWVKANHFCSYGRHKCRWQIKERF